MIFLHPNIFELLLLLGSYINGLTENLHRFISVRVYIQYTFIML